MALVVAVAVSLLALTTTGELVAQALLDPGAGVRYGLPVSRAVHDIAAAATVGTAVLAAFALPGNPDHRGVSGIHQWRLARWGALAAGCWALAGLGLLVLTTAHTIGMPLTDPGLFGQVVFFATELQAGRTRVLSVALVLVTVVLLAFPSRIGRLGWAGGLSIAALLPLALSGHAAGADEHANAVNSLGVHLIGVTIWVGGLLALCVLAPRLGRHLRPVTLRYSRLALVAFAAVALSGVVNGLLRLQGPEDLFAHPYGRLLLVKIAALAVLGTAGWVQRQRILPSLDGPTGTRRFVRLAAGEIVVMALTVGVSVALSASAPPVPQERVTYDVQHALLGFAPPPPVSPVNLLTQVQPDWMLIAAVLLASILYLRGVRILTRRSVTWPIHRTICWLLAMVLLVFSTSGGLGVYGRLQFSTHMLQHMSLMMVIPLLLVLGAPVLLALRALPVRRDGSRGVREWLLVILQSRYGHFITRPVVAGVIFAGSLIAFYFTGWFEWALRDHGGHVVMQAHFLLTGYVFFWVLIGVDPGPRKPPHLVRLLVLLVTMVFHAFFGISVMALSYVLAEDWWNQLGFTDTEALLADQSVGGAIAWGAGEFPVIIAALVLAAQWLRSDERQARRLDERAVRDGDRELHDYNDYLRRLHAQDEAGSAAGSGTATALGGDSPPGAADGAKGRY
ncbi:cytochrome c oxidase assembly protein [Pseudactinotalea sp. Z1732]|uniref:cytochrome c oxidase assembly protein n=1 Tax=Micrococcales TaxID=85006 RepID=UPI003C7B5600